MSKEIQNPKYDLEERTAKFGESIICLVNKLQKNLVNIEIIKQIVRSGTSIGANYMEANAAESKKDFRHKIGICKKESKETMHWLRMLAVSNLAEKDVIRNNWREAKELLLIFSSIFSK